MKKPISASEAARALLSHREQKESKCQVCGKAFVGLRSRRYCSRSCQQRAYLKRKADQAGGAPAPDAS